MAHTCHINTQHVGGFHVTIHDGGGDFVVVQMQWSPIPVSHTLPIIYKEAWKICRFTKLDIIEMNYYLGLSLEMYLEGLDVHS